MDLFQFALAVTEELADALKESDNGIGLLVVFLFGFRHALRSLLSFPVQGVFPAESAILLHFQSVGVVFLFFLAEVVPLLALCAGQHDLYSHISAPPLLG